MMRIAGRTTCSSRGATQSTPVTISRISPIFASRCSPFVLYTGIKVLNAGPGTCLSVRPPSTRRHLHQRAAGVRVHGLRNTDWPEAVLFDCDGVIAETERDGHRVAFNKAFKQKGLVGHEWSVEEYGRLLEIGGGKERMTAYFLERESEEPFKSLKDESGRRALVAELHELKTDLFLEMVAAGGIQLRPGVRRLVGEALAGGAKVAVCSTSAERTVSTIVRVLLGDAVAEKMPVFAGDMVSKKKPNPAIYLMAAEALGVQPKRCVVIEDSRIGLLAARAAGMRCIVTMSSYTVDEDFSTADAIFDCLGDEGAENVHFHDLTTPGSFWLNPPLPIDADGNWYSTPTAVTVDVDTA